MRLSVIVITKNEEKMIKDCLDSVRQLADEILIIDSGSEDKTLKIARKYTAKIFTYKNGSFSDWRNFGLRKARGDWVLYVDADERMTSELKEEIELMINDQLSMINAYAVPRRNFYLGREVRFGGAWPDYVKRLFKKKALSSWEGRLHEEPVFKGELGHLQEPMIHITHRDLSSMIEKTRQWSKIEAELLFQAGHPPVTWWRVLRIMLSEFWKRGIKLQGWRDGTVGWIELFFQMFSRAVTYIQLWELQQKK
jgi:glycosyltransferase involved in cell wall biosynthesis